MRVWLLLGCLVGALGLSGCATGNAEDDAFFNRGWVNPKELDTFGTTPKSRPRTAPGLKMDPLSE